MNNHFEHLLAKNALGFMVGKYGLNAFSKIYSRNNTCTANDVGRWVGTDGRETLPIESNAIHTAGVFKHASEITVRIKLFSLYKESPEYIVVVGMLEDVIG